MNRQQSKKEDLARLAERVEQTKREQRLRRTNSAAAEKKILILSLITGMLFAGAEFIFAIYSHSQSVLMDAAYDASELVVILLTLFLIQIFREPVSEKHPYGFLQVESMFIIVKGFTMLAVSISLSAKTVEIALSGGNEVDGGMVSLMELGMGIASVAIFAVMLYLNRSVSSPAVKAELLGWRLDIAYSLGLSVAFFLSTFLDKTPLAFLSSYVDPLIAAIIVVLTIPENLKLLWGAIKDVFLFSPEGEIVEKIKAISHQVLKRYSFKPIFFDITRTGRHMWASVYFQVPGETLVMDDLRQANAEFQEAVTAQIEECTAELIVAAGMENDLPFQLELMELEEDDEDEDEEDDD